MSELPIQKPAGRLHSLDALRGFNMFWIMTGADIVDELLSKFHNKFIHAINSNLTEHVEWEGFHFHDMIFPLFLFIIGVALPYTLAKRRERGDSQKHLQLKIIKRTVTLIVLALLAAGLLEFKGFDHLRIMGVLQRLALGYGCAATILLYTKERAQAAICAGLLILYWILMIKIPVPGVPLGSMTQMGNVANYFDRKWFLPGQLYTSYGDPEGLFSTIPAISTALLGVLCGQWLLSDRTQLKKVFGLVIAGIACIALGYAWSPWFPVIKKIWTSSYVLIAGGWSMLLLALFYWLIDIKGWKKWAAGFVVIGLNPLTIYLGQRFIRFEYTAKFFFGGIAHLTPVYEGLIMAIAVFGIKWLFLYFLHRQKIYLRV